jgi:hypothetical protein
MEYSIRTQSSKFGDYLQICLCYTISSMSLMRGSCHHVWGWFYLSTILDDYSRYIIAWKLCTTMRAEDVTDTIEMALQASGCDQATARLFAPTIAINRQVSLPIYADFWVLEKLERAMRFELTTPTLASEELCRLRIKSKSAIS